MLDFSTAQYMFLGVTCLVIAVVYVVMIRKELK